MKIGIFGTGNIGGTLGRLWAGHGHSVFFGTRDPHSEKVRALLADCGEQAGAGSVAEAAAFGEVVLVATPWAVAAQVVGQAGDLSGKVLIDATNPIGPGFLSAVPNTTSVAEQIAARAAGAHVVKAFNTIGWNMMANPHVNGQAIDMFICGDDAAAKATVATLAAVLGFEVRDAGGLEKARLLEPMALLWITFSRQPALGRDIGFKLLAA